MYQKNFIKTLLTLSLFSVNLSATNLCHGNSCMVDLSALSIQVEDRNLEDIKEDKYETMIIDNMETIVFSKNAYKASEDEVSEYELDQLAKSVEEVILEEEHLPNSDYFCEENLKVVMIEESEKTYICA